jgi:hypothetical protein
VTEVRMLLDTWNATPPRWARPQRLRPDVAAALLAIENDQPARERYLAFARDADEAVVQARMMALARSWAG